MDNSTATVAGGPANAGSQGSGIDSQGSDQNQGTVSTQVEGSDSQPSSTEGAGGQKSSKFYQERNREKQTIRELRESQRALEEKIARLESGSKSPAPSQAKSDPAKDAWFQEFLVDPNGTIQKLIDGQVSKVVGMEKIESAKREAEKLIASSDAYKRDPDAFIANMRVITSDPEYEYLDLWSNSNPVGATKKALEIYAEKYGTRQASANAPKKGQLVSTATGSPSATGGMSKEALIGELKKMQSELSENMNLRKDPKFWEKYKGIKEQLSSK